MKTPLIPAMSILAMSIVTFLIVATVGYADPEPTCVPVIEFVREYAWDPAGPVSVCVLPGAAARTYLAGGQQVAASLRFPVVDIDGGPMAFATVPVEWYRGGPEVICGPYAVELMTDAEGWVSLFPEIRGGGHRGPDEPADILLWIPVCPNQQLDVLDGVCFNSPDLNGDLQVDLSDIPLFAADFFSGYDYRSDFNWDGVINLSDTVILAQAVGTVCE